MGLSNDLCYPVSKFWWTDGSTSCTFESAPVTNASCHDKVDLSLCFEDTAILFGICAVFWVLAGLTCCHRNSIKPSLDFGFLHAIKLVLLLIPFWTAVGDFIYTIYQDTRGDVAKFQYLAPVAVTASIVLSGLVIHRDRLRGHRSSGLMLIFWLGLVIYGSFKLRTYILIDRDQTGVKDKFRFSTFCLQYLIYLFQFVLSIVSEPKKIDYSILTEREPSPEEDAHFLSRITWWWQNKQIWNGWRRPIKYDDLTDLNMEDKSKQVAANFQRNWQRELSKAGISFRHKQSFYDVKDEGSVSNGNHKQPNSTDKTYLLQDPDIYHQEEQNGHRRKNPREPSLVKALVKSFGEEFAVIGVLKFFQDLLNFVSPLLLKLIIQFTEDKSQPNWHGYVYAVLLFSTALVQSLILNQYFYRAYVIGMRIRTAVIAAVYNKALRLSSKARHNRTTGEIVNLMSVDAQRFKDLMPILHMIWSAPLQIVLSLVFLYLTMGPSIFAGFAILVLMIPFNLCLVSWMKRVQAKQMRQKDSRIRLINEVLNGIKIIKLYAWELPFQRLISGIRFREVHELKKAAYLNAFTSFAWNSVPFTVAVVTFATYSLVNLNNPSKRLTAAKAFVALSLFNVLRFPLATLPTLISSLAQASVSEKRLSAFLRSEELDPNIVEWKQDPATGDEAAVLVTNASFLWCGAERATVYNSCTGSKVGVIIRRVHHRASYSLLSHAMKYKRRLL